MDMVEKRKNMVANLQISHSELGKIDNVLEHVEILCDKCAIRKECNFVYDKNAVRFKDIPLKAGQEESDFTTWECMFLVTNPKFELLKYTGKKKEE